MREARLILPTTDATIQAVGKTINDVSARFGGVTITEGYGRWKSEQEDVFILDIAYEPSFINDSELYDLANAFREDAKQEAVYLRYGNGFVQLVMALSCMDNGEETFDWEKLQNDLHRLNDDPNDVIEAPEHVAIS